MQTDEQRAGLLGRYGPEKLFQAERNFNAAQDLDVSVQEGDLVGVIKQQDPMGSNSRWLIDNGGMLFGTTYTFLPKCLLFLKSPINIFLIISGEGVCIQFLPQTLQPTPESVGRIHREPIF